MSVETFSQPQAWSPPVLPESFSGYPSKESKLKPPIIPIHTLDGRSPHEIDDGFFLEEIHPDVYLTHVGLANAASLITPESAQYRQAYDLVHTIYYEDFVESMLDPKVVNKFLNLEPGQVRPAIITSIAVDTIKNQAQTLMLQRGFVKSKQQWSFSQVDRLVNQPQTHDRDTSMFKQAALVALSLSIRRHIGDEPYQIHPDKQAIESVTGKHYSARKFFQEPARMIVDEFMILSNEKIAEFAHLNQIPILYRSCSSSKGSPRAYYSVYPDAHGPLSLDQYTHLTSQLRRFADLVNGIQLNAYLTNPHDPHYPLTPTDMVILADHINQYQFPAAV